MITADRIKLYKAAKYEASKFGEDCGMNTAEMWSRISGDPAEMAPNDQFWWATCIDDYENKRNF